MLKFDLCEDCWLLVAPLPAELCMTDQEFQEVWNAQPAEKGRILLRGQIQETPRKQQPYELPYFFSGMLHKPDDRYPTPEYAKRLQTWLANLDQWPFNEYKFVPNEILLNWYRKLYNSGRVTKSLQ